MALHYFKNYEQEHNSLNFGDSINPMLCSHFFDKSIIDSQDICLIGIGTILNNRNVERVQHFQKKVVFSSGTGYGDFNINQDESWEFVCVRGPLTAKKLNLPVASGICDGAILLADMFPPQDKVRRSGILFIPHVNTVWSSGTSLQQICCSLNIGFISPGAPAKNFINAVRNAELVVTEAMHGAILADAMRTPWLPLDMRGVEQFKWQDWFKSIELQGAPKPVKPMLYDEQLTNPVGKLPSYLKAKLKILIVKQKLKKLLDTTEPFLSKNDVFQQRLKQLHAKVDYINDTYAK